MNKNSLEQAKQAYLIESECIKNALEFDEVGIQSYYGYFKRI